MSTRKQNLQAEIDFSLELSEFRGSLDDFRKEFGKKVNYSSSKGYWTNPETGEMERNTKMYQGKYVFFPVDIWELEVESFDFYGTLLEWTKDPYSKKKLLGPSKKAWNKDYGIEGDLKKYFVNDLFNMLESKLSIHTADLTEADFATEMYRYEAKFTKS